VGNRSEFITEALEVRLASTTPPTSLKSGWRSVFGLVEPKTVESIDLLIAAEFEQVDHSEWD
jgi:hypothetical protein